MSEEGAKNLSWLWLYPLRGWGSLTITFLGKFAFVVLSEIYVCKIEEDIVTPSKLLFYKRDVDDTYVRRKKNETDELYNG